MIAFESITKYDFADEVECGVRRGWDSRTGNGAAQGLDIILDTGLTRHARKT